MSVGLILAAAGSGSRLGGVPKQIRPLSGRPVVAWSLAAFAGLIDEAVIVTSDNLAPVINAIMRLEAPPHPWQVVLGGNQRLNSVARGLQHLSSAVDVVLVHDAARPLIEPAAIRACLQALHQAPAAILATPCSASLKRGDQQQHIVEAIDRRQLWLAQTPQGFHRDAGEQAFAQALALPAAAQALLTDDASVLQAAGYECQLLPGSSNNIKITTAADWDLCEAFMLWRQQNLEGMLIPRP